MFVHSVGEIMNTKTYISVSLIVAFLGNLIKENNADRGCPSNAWFLRIFSEAGSEGKKLNFLHLNQYCSM